MVQGALTPTGGEVDLGMGQADESECYDEARRQFSHICNDESARCFLMKNDRTVQLDRKLDHVLSDSYVDD